MFYSTFTNTESGPTVDLLLITNPSANTYAAKDIFFSIAETDTKTSLWEIYLSPTVTSNGTLQTSKDFQTNSTTANTVLVYKRPTISSYGNPVRKFTVPSRTQEFSTNLPAIYLEPGKSILIRRASALTGSTTSYIRWIEVSTN